jgi:3'-phosphoadenosine 5'-phosphosulfate sulfotransferase (PAPS reductase)/FAD synthetase
MEQPVWVCYGGGTDSTAMLIEMVNNNERIDLITFADTGAELPHTYDMVIYMHRWLMKKGYPGINVVKYSTRAGDEETLEESVIKNLTVPSLAFGWHTCSIRFKITPQVRFAKTLPLFQEAWASGMRVVRCIGYDFGAADSRRVEKSTTQFPDMDEYQNRYPLREWKWTREKCREVIAANGFPDPGKSSCYFCPARKKHEIHDMKINNPDYYQKALDIEEAALWGGKLRTVAGLGRSFAWKDV